MKLDKTDRRILDVLQRDGRISVTDLAERVGLSPTPCARRIRQLESAGLIQGYAAIIDPKRAGQTIQAIVQIKLEQHSDEIVERFRRTLIDRDRKSTRLNSSHSQISYAVFCLKKKKKKYTSIKV